MKQTINLLYINYKLHHNLKNCVTKKLKSFFNYYMNYITYSVFFLNTIKPIVFVYSFYSNQELQLAIFPHQPIYIFQEHKSINKSASWKVPFGFTTPHKTWDSFKDSVHYNDRIATRSVICWVKNCYPVPLDLKKWIMILKSFLLEF